MVKENKTKETDSDVNAFLDQNIPDKQKRLDADALIKLFGKWSGFEPKMWGASIVGFGIYHYKYKSGHSGNAPLIGFSPRKTNFSLYVFAETPANKLLLKTLGKFKMGVSCIYVNKLADIEIGTLEQICLETIRFLKFEHPYRIEPSE